MPTLIRLSRKYNAPLYQRLAALLGGWEEVSAPDQLAMMIAHQSALEIDIRNAKLNREQSALERKSTVKRYLDALSKARKIWLEMENEDQISLSSCMREIGPGHMITDIANADLLMTSFSPTEDMAEWRKGALAKHQFWGPDTEMLDLLIGTAQLWLEEEAPKPYTKIDPRLYAVIYMAEACKYSGIDPSPAESSRFTEIVQAYFQHTDLGDAAKPEEERTSFKDLIRKANEIREQDTSNDVDFL